MYSLQATPHCPTPLWSLGLVDVWKPHLKDPGSITQELRCPCQSKLLMLAKFMHPVIYRVTRTSLHRNLPPFFPLYFFIRPLCLFSLILFWRSLQISLPAFLSGCDDLKRVFLGCQLNSRSWPDALRQAWDEGATVKISVFRMLALSVWRYYLFGATNLLCKKLLPLLLFISSTV